MLENSSLAELRILTRSSTEGARFLVRYERQRQRHPAEAGRYKFNGNCRTRGCLLAGKLGRSKQRPYQFKTNVEREEPAGLRRYLFSAGLLPCRAATDVAA